MRLTCPPLRGSGFCLVSPPECSVAQGLGFACPLLSPAFTCCLIRAWPVSPVAGAAEPGELWEHLHRLGSAELPAHRPAAAGRPEQLQTPAAWRGRLHDVREHQGAAGRAQPAVPPHEPLPHRAEYVAVAAAACAPPSLFSFRLAGWAQSLLLRVPPPLRLPYEPFYHPSCCFVPRNFLLKKGRLTKLHSQSLCITFFGPLGR